MSIWSEAKKMPGPAELMSGVPTRVWDHTASLAQPILRLATRHDGLSVVLPGSQNCEAEIRIRRRADVEPVRRYRSDVSAS